MTVRVGLGSVLRLGSEWKGSNLEGLFLQACRAGLESFQDSVKPK